MLFLQRGDAIREEANVELANGKFPFSFTLMEQVSLWCRA
jgi:hypothetical protein